MPVSGGTMGAVAQSYRAGQATLDAAVVPGVRKLWGTYMDPGKMTDSWENLRGPLGRLIAQSYLASANSGARYYNASRVAAGFPAIKVKLAPSPTPEQIAATTGGTGIGAFLHQIKQGARWMDAYASACDSLAAAVSRLVLSGGRHTVTTMSVADPKCLGWRRITSGTCDYCEALAGEGIAVDAEDFPAHNYCQCQAAPEFGTSTTGGEVPPGEGDGGMGLDLSDIFDMSPEEALAEGIDLEVIGETFAEELVIEDPQWAKVIEFIGNALSSGNLKGVDAYLNADGTVNDGKAILKLLKDYKSPGYKPYPAQPYDLGGNKPLNKTMTKMLDKFFGKGGDQIVEDAKQTVLEKIGIPAPAPKTPGITEDFIKSINQKASDLYKKFNETGDSKLYEAGQKVDHLLTQLEDVSTGDAQGAAKIVGNIQDVLKSVAEGPTAASADELSLDAILKSKDVVHESSTKLSDLVHALQGDMTHPTVNDLTDKLSKLVADQMKAKAYYSDNKFEYAKTMAEKVLNDSQDIINAADEALAEIAPKATGPVVDNLTDAQKIVDELYKQYSKSVVDMNTEEADKAYQVWVDATNAIHNGQFEVAGQIAADAGVTLDSIGVAEVIPTATQVEGYLAQVLEKYESADNADMKNLWAKFTKAKQAYADYEELVWQPEGSSTAALNKLKEAFQIAKDALGEEATPAAEAVPEAAPVKYSDAVKMMNDLYDKWKEMSQEDELYNDFANAYYHANSLLQEADMAATPEQSLALVQQIAETVNEVMPKVASGGASEAEVIAKAAKLTAKEVQALLDDPKLAEAVNSWKTGNYDARKLIKDDITKVLTTGQPADNPANQLIADAIKHASTKAPELYRGLAWDMHSAWDRANYEAMTKKIVNKATGEFNIGKFWDSPMSSFSHEMEFPLKFQHDLKTGNDVRNMMITVEDGARGLNIEPLGMTQGEAEWLTGGRFRITGLTHEGNTWHMTLKQTRALDKIKVPVKKIAKPESAVGTPFSTALNAAISEWKGSSRSLSTEMLQIMRGEKVTSVRAKALVDAVETRTTKVPGPLYRGMHWYSPDAHAKKLIDALTKVGGQVDLSPASYTVNSSTAESFSSGGDVQMVLTVQKARGFDISQVHGFAGEAEWMSGGRYEVVSATPPVGYNSKWKVTIRMLQSLEKGFIPKKVGA